MFSAFGISLMGFLQNALALLQIGLGSQNWEDWASGRKNNLICAPAMENQECNLRHIVLLLDQYVISKIAKYTWILAIFLDLNILTYLDFGNFPGFEYFNS